MTKNMEIMNMDQILGISFVMDCRNLQGVYKRRK